MITILLKSYPIVDSEIIHRKTLLKKGLSTGKERVIHLSRSLTTTTNYI